MRDAFASRLAERAAQDERIMFITGDLGFGVFEDFRRDFPRQYLNAGVAEQNMIALATGLALEGRIVYVYSIGNFPVLRCLEQIRNDAAYHEANVKVVSIGGGFSYGPLGMSHHATEDLAVTRSMPSLSTLVPGTRDDVRHAFDQCLDTPGTCYLRLDKSSGTEALDAEPWRRKRWRRMRAGEDAVLIAAGGILGEAQKAAELLATEGLEVAVVNATNLEPIEEGEVLRAVGTSPLVLTLEEHVVRGGLGGAVAEAMAEAGLSSRLLRRGIGRQFMSTVGSQSFLRQQCGLDAESLVRDVCEQLGS